MTPFSRPIPVVVTRRRGFSLVLSLTVMSMLLLLCVGAAAMLAIELRVSRVTVAYARARLSAMAGARTALGELQRLAGPDQRATAQADILTAPDESASAPANPAEDSAYNSSFGRPVTHPRWVGVWNSGVADDSGARSGFLARTAGQGYLTDTRFASGRKWETSRAALNAAEASPRLLGWLVSGAEAVPVSGASAVTGTPGPFDAIDTSKDVAILGRGTLGTLADSTSRSDKLGVTARRVAIKDRTDAETGESYAYAVFDEGVKARVNLADPFEGMMPDATGSPGNGGYARLMIPQRHHFEGITSPVPSAPSIASLKTSDNSSGVVRVPHSFGDLASINPGLTAAETAQLRAAYFQDFSFVSSGLQTDMVKGGLKRDLTPFVQSDKDIADIDGVAGSGLKSTDPIVTDGGTGPNGDSLAQISPRFGLLRNWWLSGGGAPLKFNANKVTPVAPTGYDKQFLMKPTPHGPLIACPPQWRKLPDLANQIKGSLAPQLTECMLFVAPRIEVIPTGSTTGYSRAQIRARISLWNPYSVPLDISGFTVDYSNALYLWLSFQGISGGVGSNVYSRPWIRFIVPNNLVLKPGQSVVLVVDGAKASPAPNVSNQDVVYGSRDGSTAGRESIPLVASAPSVAPNARQSYLDTARYSGGSISTSSIPAGWPSTPVVNSTVGISFGLFTSAASGLPISGDPNDASCQFDDAAYNVNRILISGPESGAVQGAAPSVYRELNLNPYCPAAKEFLSVRGADFTRNTNQRIYRPISLLISGGGIYDFQTTSDLLDSVSAESNGEGNSKNPLPLAHYGVRMKFFDETIDSEKTDTAPGSSGGSQSLQFAPLADLNPLSARITRTPFDAISRVAQKNIYLGGLWTCPDQAFYANDPGLPQEGNRPDKFTPFFDGTNIPAKDYPGVIVRDVPFEETGILSLGQFRHAPLNNLPYGPTLSFGSSHIPLPATSTDAMTDRTGLDSGTRAGWWSVLSQKWSLVTGAIESLRQVDRLGQSAQDIYDIAFEQNYALWDSFWVSGIPYSGSNANPGWSPSVAWKCTGLTASDRAKYMPNGRLEETEASSSTAKALIADDGAPLYRAAATLRVAGAFNVNSTSYVAWRSLLAAFRGIRVPTLAAGNAGSDTVSPYPRVLRPKVGDAAGKTMKDEATWSGFRVLTDAELDKLALKIVNEVKLRGPFLSLSDFVNRRLRKPDADLGSWEAKEKNYLGALDGAILAANLNSQYDGDIVKRGVPDNQSGVTPYSGGTGDYVPIKPQFKSKYKVSGAPGCLEQGDLLQPLGSVLTARSDTFAIRALGECDGASAAVELVVRRSPVPVSPATSSTGGISLNPKALPDGTQFFGRRFITVSTRWMTREEL